VRTDVVIKERAKSWANRIVPWFFSLPNRSTSSCFRVSHRATEPSVWPPDMNTLRICWPAL
jgi:hypothetical protein